MAIIYTMHIGMENYVLTTATTQTMLEGFFATTVTWLSDAVKRQKYLNQQQLISDFTLDKIEYIGYAGEEEVFDIQVEGTENFIANGLVSHNTRWHELDLAGRLLEQQKNGGDKWEIINLQAIDDNKKALWPAWYPLPALERIKANIGPREFSALYQQKPQPEEGVYFKREWFNRYTLCEHPKNTNCYGAGDYAVSDGEGDFSEEGIIEVDTDKNIWFTDWWSGQTSPDIWIESTIDMQLKHNPECWLAESGVIKKSVEPFLVSRMQQRNSWVMLEWLATTGDKRAMARSFQGMAAAGKVFIPLCEWGDALIDQLIRFDSGVFDDKVDVCGLFGRHLASIWVNVDTNQKNVNIRSDYGFNDDEDDSDWKTT